MRWGKRLPTVVWSSESLFSPRLSRWETLRIWLFGRRLRAGQYRSAKRIYEWRGHFYLVEFPR